MLPNFIIIGATKAGTTALYWYLAEHPQIYMSPMKESNYFAYGQDEEGRMLYGDPEFHRFRVRSSDDYQALFAGANGSDAIGEASPIYLECPDVPGRIRDLIPNARIVCGLRNPVDRAYSDYLMFLRKRNRCFDPDRDLTPDAPWAQPDSHWMQIGKYYELLSRYCDVFPRRQMHVFLFDDLKRNSKDVAQAVFRFLAVDPSFVPDLATPHNIGGLPTSFTIEKFLTNKTLKAAAKSWLPRRAANWVRRLRTANLQSAPPLPTQLRAELTRHFHDDIVKTAELIGRDLDDWL